MTRVLWPRAATRGLRSFKGSYFIEKLAAAKRYGDCRSCGNRYDGLRRFLLDDFHNLLGKQRTLSTVTTTPPTVASSENSGPRNTTFLLLPHVVVAVSRVMTGERRAWRKEEVANEEIGTALRGGQPFRTQSWQGTQSSFQASRNSSEGPDEFKRAVQQLASPSDV